MADLSQVQKVRDAAQALRFVNLVAAFAALCWVVVALGARQAEEGGSRVLPTIATAGIIVTPLLLALGAYRLSRSIDAGPPVLWLIGSLLGCIGILVVLRLCSKATAWFRKQGLKVGLLGPTPESLAAFETAHVEPPPGP